MKNHNGLNFREVRSDELGILQEISRKTFYDTFSWYNTPEDMEKYLNENLSQMQLQIEWENPDSTFYYAELDGEVVGYLKVNEGTAQTEKGQNNSLEIERIYVLKDFQGKRIGKYLLEQSIMLTRAKKYTTLWLAVWEKNTHAITFYEKNGFQVFGSHIFVLGEDRQTDILMKIELN